MNGFFLLIPFFLIRFALTAALSREALGRAARFAPVRGRERAAYYIYQLSNAGIVLYPAFLTVQADASWIFCRGLHCYGGGLLLCAAAVVSFAAPDSGGLNTNGLYRISRNPMYLAYFVCFLGMALLTRSPALLGLTLVFQASAHWIILAEERWCLEQFGQAYGQYMARVRRYL